MIVTGTNAKTGETITAEAPKISKSFIEDNHQFRSV